MQGSCLGPVIRYKLGGKIMTGFIIQHGGGAPSVCEKSWDQQARALQSQSQEEKVCRSALCREQGLMLAPGRDAPEGGCP